jgi:thiamine pyrophosphate-dependent acetolactate synthase large subunit-like protein
MDIVGLGESYGVPSVRVDNLAGLEAELRCALAADGPSDRGATAQRRAVVIQAFTTAKDLTREAELSRRSLSLSRRVRRG